MWRWYLGLRCAVALVATGCATVAVPGVGQEPLPAQLYTLARALVAKAERLCALLEHRGAVCHDPALARHIQEITTDVVQAHPSLTHAAVQCRVLRDPSFNAFALANGTIFLRTGILAHLYHPAELTLLLGHEVAHVAHRDVLDIVRHRTRRTVAAKVTDLLLSPPLAALGLDAVSEQGIGCMYQAAINGYAREHETRADREGLAALTQTRHDPASDITLFTALMNDATLYQEPRRWAFLATHPPMAVRLAAVAAQLGLSLEDEAPRPQVDAEFLRVMAGARYNAMALLLQQQQCHCALAIAEDMVARDPRDARALYYQGEAYRLLADDWLILARELSLAAWQPYAQQGQRHWQEMWLQQAHEAYTTALRADRRDPMPHRGLGLLLAAHGTATKAIEHFEIYLRRTPRAADRRFIRHHIDQLRPQQERP